jgi:PAS domain S-box-containing protein
MEKQTLGENRDFRALFDEVDGVALWTATEPGRFDYISSGFEDIWGIPPSAVEADASRLLDTIHPDDRERVQANMESGGQDNLENVYEARVVRPGGSVRWVRTRQVLIEDAGGTFREVVGISTDITEQKRREQELEMLTRIVRHDIRNDMAVMLGWAELLSDHVSEEGEPFVERIRTSGEHIVELTDVAGEYVEMVTDEDDLTVEPISIRSVLETELDLRRESFPNAHFDVPEPIPDVQVEANSMLRSVFRNIFTNAINHNDTAEPVVAVTVDVGEETVTVSIADNGPGVPDHLKDVSFEKGAKGMESSGTGLGLYLVHRLVEQYGGRVWAEDNEPRGAVFVVELHRVE